MGQEVIKALSGKFHPIFQWMYFDSLESLPDPEQIKAAGGGGADEYAPLGSRWAEARTRRRQKAVDTTTRCMLPSAFMVTSPVRHLAARYLATIHCTVPVSGIDYGYCITCCSPRFDPQIAVFGRTMQRRLAALKLFLVRSDAVEVQQLQHSANEYQVKR